MLHLLLGQRRALLVPRGFNRHHLVLRRPGQRHGHLRLVLRQAQLVLLLQAPVRLRLGDLLGDFLALGDHLVGDVSGGALSQLGSSQLAQLPLGGGEVRLQLDLLLADPARRRRLGALLRCRRRGLRLRHPRLHGVLGVDLPPRLRLRLVARLALLLRLQLRHAAPVLLHAHHALQPLHRLLHRGDGHRLLRALDKEALGVLEFLAQQRMLLVDLAALLQQPQRLRRVRRGNHLVLLVSLARALLLVLGALADRRRLGKDRCWWW
mmetsp:Transcript_12115/g.29282  ORF Transcript_12115/g.29282 Transcript_12115/m.29282 type:complete len:265 (-) Transcript_12115:426-1220(-)